MRKCSAEGMLEYESFFVMLEELIKARRAASTEDGIVVVFHQIRPRQECEDDVNSINV